MATAGMMNEAYFTGRKEIVAWIQGKYQPNLQRVEDLCTGAVYCQIIDSIYPNSVQLGKVKFQAKTETDFIHNFKVLQAAFVKNKLDRHIDVEKLCKRNFQMNLEFIQWMKILHDTMVDPSDTSYNAEERLRAAGVKPLEATKIGAGGTGGGAKRAPAPPVAKKENVQPASRPAVGGASAKAAAVDTSGGKLAQAQLEITDLKLTVDGLEKERDFYFGKLRDIEILCQTHEDQSLPFLQNVLSILYQTEDDFVTPTDAEPLSTEA
ncbi:hypothetical protein KFE25_000027 [Diacronema lutheri]|uniref:Microtubule-associated protein RP/EB family member 1 n=2 Tax=Diacronema lutheri TaxID=2081491 RepID=A0A8J5XG02_DIALT|nr:hypothetical protein KFE25_000027 [Diacronema lutheri]